MTMTHEEIIAQAKVGWFAVFRAEIVDVDKTDTEMPVRLRQFGWLHQPDIIAIEPPPETDAEKIARLEARIAELEGVVSALPTGWIAWNGGENPAPGKLVRYRVRDGDEKKHDADGLRWTREGWASDIVAYQVIG